MAFLIIFSSAGELSYHDNISSRLGLTDNEEWIYKRICLARIKNAGFFLYYLALSLILHHWVVRCNNWILDSFTDSEIASKAPLFLPMKCAFSMLQILPT
jgi:hypothetical protein